MIHLKSIRLRALPASSKFPFSLPILHSLQELQFETPVSLLVGENITGKSTILESIACAVEMIIVGSESTRSNESLALTRELAKFLRLSWTKRTSRGFFLRAEDFFGYAKLLNRIRYEMESDLKDKGYKDRDDFAQQQARISFTHELNDLRHQYGDGLDTHSHGESFLALFQSRFKPNGLYMLDEPEAPLSPIPQLALIAAIKDMVSQDGQFINATHSPILMAFPDATIFNFDHDEIHQAHYKDLEQVKLVRDFLHDPQAFLNRL
jgi:predicted ATPase